MCLDDGRVVSNFVAQVMFFSVGKKKKEKTVNFLF